MNNSNTPRARLLITAIIMVLTLPMQSCVSHYARDADRYAAQGEWLKAVMEYRAAVEKNPGNIEYRSRREQMELRAADYYYQSGRSLADKGDWDAAARQFQQGLLAKPDYSKLRQALNEVAVQREADSLYQEALRTLQAGNSRDALRQLQRALAVLPGHAGALAAKEDIERNLHPEEREDAPGFGSKTPLVLNFRNTDIRNAFEFIGKSIGINVIFDEGVKGAGVTLYAKDVTFEQALDLVLKTTKTFHKKIGDKTIIVIPDTPEKRRQYEDYVVRTFFLNALRAKEMYDIIKGLMKVNSMIINEKMNALVVRDSEDTVSLVAKLIEASDRKPAEILLEVEILEINRSKAERLGLDFGGYQIGASLPASEPIPFKSNIADIYGSRATLSLPALTFRFYKQDVDAKVLANPKVRVLSGKSAKIHIGDRVPLRAATITDATGQVRTTYDYKEIGIRLTAEPLVNIDNSVEVKLGLEVSSLGENIGTPEEPAFRIGTRNADTFMLLRDGETAILGGLIRDEERSTRVRLPGLGDIPLIGSLFSNYDDSGGRTDVLLTITPRVVRGWDLPRKDLREFFSGNADNYMTRSLYENGGSAKPAANPAADAPKPGAGAGGTPPAPATSAAAPPLLGFSQPVYEVAAKESLEIALTAEGFAPGSVLTWDLVFDKALLTHLKSEGDGVSGLKTDPADGAIHITATVARQEPKPTVRIGYRAEQPGIAYLVLRAPTATRGAGGETFVPRIQAARVLVR